MSFSKAKIHRFNDDLPCAPPPGTYNPATIDKTVGPKINKSERFTDGKTIFSSCESLNEIDGCKTPFSQFKTPKVPASSSKFEMKRNSTLSQRKAASTEFIYKKIQSSSYEINSLKSSLNDLQEELALERNKTNNLSKEIQKLKDSYLESDKHTEYLNEVLDEQTNLMTILDENCSTLEKIAFESFDLYDKHIAGVYTIFEYYVKLWKKSETDFGEIFQKYETLISDNETNFHEILSFLCDLLRRNDSIENIEGITSKPMPEIINFIQESEKERKKYEVVVNEMQKVIVVLKDRVHESDQEVEKLTEIISSLKEENKKISETVLMNSLNDVKTTEKYLLGLLDSLKDTYEKQLLEKNTLIARLRMEKSQKELQLQESLDVIETYKCKEQNTEHMLEQVRNECCELKNMLQDCQEQLNQRAFYDESYLSDDSTDLNITFTKESFPSAETTTAHAFLKQLFELTTQQMNSANEKPALIELVSSDIENKPISIEDIKTDWDKLPNKVEWLRSMLNLVQNTLYKFNAENVSLKSQNNRLRDDFVEKCDECAGLTKLLQVSEKRVENLEQCAEEVELIKKDLEEKLSSQREQFEALKDEKIALEEKLMEQKFETKNNEVMVASLTEELDKLRQQVENNADKTKLQNSLKDAQTKLRTVEKENSRLSKLIGPFRQTLEKYEAETAFMSSKSESDVLKKYSKLLDLQNTKQQMKQITKLRSDIVQLRKKNDELQTEINKFRKVASKSGKENRLMVKNDLTEKVTRAEIPVNSTYVITSPKVNRI